MQKIIYWLPALAWSVLIFSLSSVPSLQVTSNQLLQEIVNDGGHFSFYGLLAIFTYYGARKTGLAHSQQIAVIYSFVYGCLDELHQYFVPGRTTDIRDLILDLLGAIFALAIITRLKGQRGGK